LEASYIENYQSNHHANNYIEDRQYKIPEATRARLIYHRRLSMSDLSRTAAEQWAACFRALSDPTRLAVLHTIATAGGPLSIGELVERVDVGQSTVSHHVRTLAEAGFVHHVREGTTSRVQVNRRCLDALPAAARGIMGLGPMP
jgi:DNA-binding transcriptional ArsR family regulator